MTNLLRTGGLLSYTYKNASTSGEQFPTTPLESFGVTQNITLNRVESTAQIFLHTITAAAGGGNIVLNLVASTAQVFLPAVSVNIALNQTPSVAQVFQPAIGRNIALNQVSSTAQVFLPTITVPATSNIVLNRIDSVNNVYLLSLTGEGTQQDTSDILGKASKRKNVLTEKEEEEIAAQYLKSKQKQTQKKKKKEVKWKNLLLRKINGVEERLQEEGAPESIVEQLTDAVIRAEQPTTDNANAEIERLSEEYRQQVRAEIAAIIQARTEEIQARAKAEEEKRRAFIEAARIERERIAAIRAEEERIEALRLEAIRIEEERIAAIRAEEERRIKAKQRKWKALLILATLDND